MSGSGRRAIATTSLLLMLVAPAGAQLLAPPAAAPSPDSPAAALGSPLAPSATPPKPSAIALSDVAASAETTTQRLRAIDAESTPGPRIQAMIEALPERTQAIDEGVANVNEAIATRAGIDRLLDLDHKLGLVSEEIAGWRVLTKERAARLEAHVAELAALKETWDLTYEHAKNESAPDAVLARIRGMRTEIKDAQGRARQMRSEALTQQSDVAKLTTTLGLLSDNVKRARWEIRGRLFEADREPIWAAFQKAKSIDSVMKRLQDAAKRDIESLRVFANVSTDKFQAHGLIFAAFLVLALILRNWARGRRAAGKHLGATPRIYEKPISVALLAGLIVVPWLYPRAPLVLSGLSGLLLIGPTLLLLFEVFPVELRRLWLALAGFYLIDRARYGVQSVELLERSLFVLEMLAAAAVALWILRSGRFEQLVRVVGRPLLTRRVLQGMAAVFAFSAVADALGYFTLGKVLGEGLLSSTYAAMVLYGAVSVAEPIVPAVLGSRPLKALHVVTRYRTAIEPWLQRAIAWLAFGAWAAISLDRLTVSDPIVDALRWLVMTPVSVGTVAISLGDVLASIAIIIAAVLLSRAVRVLLEEDVLSRMPLGRGMPHAIASSAGYVISFIGVALALGAAGIDLSKVTILAGALGVGIGFGLQNVVNNFISGMILLYERPIQVGDTVEVGALTGEVRRIGIRSSTVRTFQGAEVIVPNANLISEQVVNWTLSDRQRRIELPVGVAYGTDPKRVIAILTEVAKASPDVLQDPEPLALFRGFGDSSLNFELRVWTALSNFLEVHSRIAIAVNAALEEAGIEIPFPQRVVSIKGQ